MPEVAIPLRSSRPAIVVDGQPADDLAAALNAMRIEERSDGLAHCELCFGNWGLRDGSTGPTIDTLASLLARAEALEGQTPATAVAASASGSAVHAATGQRLDAALRARVRAFQRTQGLSADGHPGPLTFMQLESALGLHTPRLLTD